MITKYLPPHRVLGTLQVLWDIRKHSVEMCYQFEPLPPDYDTTIETWLTKTTYTNKQKDMLKAKYNEDQSFKRKDFSCKSFIKAETYPEFKYPRPIKSRTDKFKVQVGPIFQGINEQLFKNTKWFIKKIPVKDRPRFLKEHLGEAERFDCSDFTSFEAHFLDALMYAIEFPFYRYFTQFLPEKQNFMQFVEKLLEVNKCIFKDFVIFSASRASGEMNTSSGNGIANLIVTSYIARAKGAVSMRASFEGDDGIFVVHPIICSPESADYIRLGWNCKHASFDKFSDASFCGILADPEELITVCDVTQYLADFGWTRQQYVGAKNTTLMALLRAKGYSALYQYPQCPIIEALGRYALRVTDSPIVHKKMRKMVRDNKIADSNYKSQLYHKILEEMDNSLPRRQEPGPNTRLLVAEKFGIDAKHQIEIENYLDSLTVAQPLSININVPEVWRLNHELYVDTCIDPDPERDYKMLVDYLTSMSIKNVVHGAQLE